MLDILIIAIIIVFQLLLLAITLKARAHLFS